MFSARALWPAASSKARQAGFFLTVVAGLALGGVTTALSDASARGWGPIVWGMSADDVARAYGGDVTFKRTAEGQLLAVLPTTEVIGRETVPVAYFDASGAVNSLSLLSTAEPKNDLDYARHLETSLEAKYGQGRILEDEQKDAGGGVGCTDRGCIDFPIMKSVARTRLWPLESTVISLAYRYSFIADADGSDPIEFTLISVNYTSIGAGL